MTDDATTRCLCGHARSAHIYEEGACRPGTPCPCPVFRVHPTGPVRTLTAAEVVAYFENEEHALVPVSVPTSGGDFVTMWEVRQAVMNAPDEVVGRGVTVKEAVRDALDRQERALRT